MSHTLQTSRLLDRLPLVELILHRITREVTRRVIGVIGEAETILEAVETIEVAHRETVVSHHQLIQIDPISVSTIAYMVSERAIAGRDVPTLRRIPIPILTIINILRSIRLNERQSQLQG